MGYDVRELRAKMVNLGREREHSTEHKKTSRKSKGVDGCHLMKYPFASTGKRPLCLTSLLGSEVNPSPSTSTSPSSSQPFSHALSFTYSHNLKGIIDLIGQLENWRLKFWGRMAEKNEKGQWWGCRKRSQSGFDSSAPGVVARERMPLRSHVDSLPFALLASITSHLLYIHTKM